MNLALADTAFEIRYPTASESSNWHLPLYILISVRADTWFRFLSATSYHKLIIIRDDDIFDMLNYKVDSH